MTIQNVSQHKKRISEIQALIENQKQSLDHLLKCLQKAKSSLAVTRIVKKVKGKNLTFEEQQLHNALIVEAFDNVSSQMRLLGKMEKKLRDMENELLFNDE